MFHGAVEIPATSDKPQFYPAQRIGGEWVGITSAPNVNHHYSNVRDARRAAAALTDGGTKIDAIIMVDRTGSAPLKANMDWQEISDPITTPPMSKHPDFGSW